MKDSRNTIRVFTLGFSQKSAEQFFNALKAANVEKLIDIRLNNESQLAGFTKKRDIRYFLKEICDIAYEHRPDFAPTKEILDAYKMNRITWTEYENQYIKLLEVRDIITQVAPEELDMGCFLCSEPKADKCHRRLLAEYIKGRFGKIDIVHL